MEALRTKIDGLQWEVSRLDSENRKLRDANVEASERVDLEAELDQLKQDYAGLKTELAASKKGLSDAQESLATVECRATEAESEVERLEKDIQTMREASYGGLAEMEQASELRFQLDDTLLELSDSKKSLTMATSEVDGLKEKLEAQRETMAKEAELNRYRCLEEERTKWEAREERIVVQLEGVRAELADLKSSRADPTLPARLITAEDRLLAAKKEIESKDQTIADLSGANEAKQLEIKKLQEQVHLLQTQLERLGSTSTRTTMSGGTTSLSTLGSGERPGDTPVRVSEGTTDPTATTSVETTAPASVGAVTSGRSVSSPVLVMSSVPHISSVVTPSYPPYICDC